MKFKMAATAGLNLTLDPMGKMFLNASSLKPLGQLKPNCPGIIIWRSFKKLFFNADRNTEVYSSLKLLHWFEPKLCINHWKVLYKLCVFYVDRNSKMTTTAGHSFYIRPIGFFYYQVNDTGSWEPLVCSDMKFKMAATAGLSLTLDPMGKMFQNASSLKPLG